MNTTNKDRLFHDSLFTYPFVFIYLNKYKYFFSIKTRIKYVLQSVHTNTHIFFVEISKILNEQLYQNQIRMKNRFQQNFHFRFFFLKAFSKQK